MQHPGNVFPYGFLWVQSGRRVRDMYECLVWGSAAARSDARIPMTFPFRYNAHKLTQLLNPLTPVHLRQHNSVNSLSIRALATSTSKMSQTPRILSSTDMDINEAKWITLKKIRYSDAAGSERQWESAERRTRKESGIDAVAIFAVISSKTNAFPKSTVIIEQYRPPIGKFVVEMPAGLIDANESPESAAIRELEEETGYKADEGGVVESSPVIVSDPGTCSLVLFQMCFSSPLSAFLQE